MPSRSRTRDLRTSDADRERVAGFLRDRCAEGRLTPDELAERLDAVWSSRTYGELEWLVGDLPGGRELLHGTRPVPVALSRRRSSTPAVRSLTTVVLVVALAAVLVHAVPLVIGLVLLPIAFVAVAFTVAAVALAVAPVMLVLGPLAWIVHRLLRGRPHAHGRF